MGEKKDPGSSGRELAGAPATEFRASGRDVDPEATVTKLGPDDDDETVIMGTTKRSPRVLRRLAGSKPSGRRLVWLAVVVFFAAATLVFVASRLIGR